MIGPGCKFGLSCDRSGVEFGLSCDRSGVEFGLSCDRIDMMRNEKGNFGLKL